MAIEQRLFVALRPSAPAAEALERIATGIDEVAWKRAEEFHLTLRFIGPAERGLREQVEHALARVDVRAFFLPLEGTGAFPPRGQPSVLWAGVGSGHPHLHQLRQQVDDNLLAASVPLELRAFAPHVTLGRCREAPPVAVQHWLKRHRDFSGPIWPVDSFQLMESVARTGRGHVYSTLRTFTLGR